MYAPKVAQAPTKTPAGPTRKPRSQKQAQPQLNAEFEGLPGPVAELPEPVRDVLNSPGQPLDAESRTYFEPRLGYDLGHVRVHADRAAAASAVSVRALAYTLGRHIAFGPGQYAPASQYGLQLLAHELVHVGQQTRGCGTMPSGSMHENEARALAAPLSASQFVRDASITPAAPSLARVDGPDSLGSPTFGNLPQDSPGPVGLRGVELTRDPETGKWSEFARGRTPEIRTASGDYDFVVQNGRLKAVRSSVQHVGHTELAGGGRVSWAGGISFSQKGNLKSWNNASGHYLPSGAFAANAASAHPDLPLDKFVRDYRGPVVRPDGRREGPQLPTFQPREGETLVPRPARNAEASVDALLPQTPSPLPGSVATGSSGSRVAGALASREEGQLVKAATEALGSTAARRLTQAEEKQLWQMAAESFSKLAIGSATRRLAQASTPVIGAVFAAPDIYRGGQDIAHGNIVLGAGTIGVALVDIAAQGLHLTDEFTAGGGTALALTIQAWCTAMQMGFEMSRIGTRARELQEYIQTHQGNLPSKEQLMGYYGLNDEDLLILGNDLYRTKPVTTADVIARVQALIAAADAAANQRTDVDPAAAARERASLGQLLVALQAFGETEKARAGQDQAATTEQARQSRLDQAIRVREAAAHPTPAQQAAAASALLPGPATPVPNQQGADLGPFLSAPQPRPLTGITRDSAELAATAFGRERSRVLQLYAQLETQHFPHDQVEAFQGAVATYVKNLDTMIGQFLSRGSAEWPGVQEMRRLRDAADNDDRSRLMR